MSEPDEEQLRLARSRVVDSTKAKQVIRACIVSVLEGVVEATNKRIGDGGTVRSVPLNADGIVPIGVEVSLEDGLRGADFIAVTEGYHNAAEKWLAFDLDWKETEYFRDIV